MRATAGPFARRGLLGCFGSGLGRSSAGTDNTHDLTLGLTDMVEQRDVGGAAVETATAFDAILHGILLESVEIACGIEPAEQERLQTHGAGIGATAAADAETLLTALGRCLGKIKNRRRTLDGGGIEIGDGDPSWDRR